MPWPAPHLELGGVQANTTGDIFWTVTILPLILKLLTGCVNCGADAPVQMVILPQPRFGSDRLAPGCPLAGSICRTVKQILYIPAGKLILLLTSLRLLRFVPETTRLFSLKKPKAPSFWVAMSCTGMPGFNVTAP